MNKEIITTKQGIFLIIIFTLGTSQIYSGRGPAKQDLWISILLAIAVAIPTILVFGKLTTMYPGKNLFQILDASFGKIIGTIISLFYILNFIHLGSLGIRDITEFIQAIVLYETPQYFSAIWVVLLAIYMVKSGFEVFARWTNFVIFIILFVIISLMLFSSSKIDFLNILPVLNNGWKPILDSAISYYTFPFAEVVVFLALFNNLNESKKVYSVLLKGITIGGFILLMITVQNILLLGFPNLNQIYFASYSAKSLISVGGFLERVEVSSAVMIFITGVAKVAVYLFAVCIGVSHLFNHKKYSDLAFPIGFSMLVLSLIIYNNTMEMIEFLDISKYYLIPFQLIIPVITLIVGGIKRKVNN